MKYVSTCCGAEVRIRGEFTQYYVCTRCKLPCDTKQKEEPMRLSKCCKSPIIVQTDFSVKDSIAAIVVTCGQCGKGE